MASFAVVLLAAGASTRFGSPKQLLPYRGRALVKHTADIALASGATKVLVIVGAEAEAVSERLEDARLEIVVNPEWREGMSSSIRCGIAALGAAVDIAIVALADQPRITPNHLGALADRIAGSGRSIVASSYDGVVGAPCAFDRSEFARLIELQGDAGARSLFRQSGEPIECIPFAGANPDIDTPADYEALLSANERR